MRNILFGILLIFLFVELILIFPKKLETNEESSPSGIPTEEEAAELGKAVEQKMLGVHLVESKDGQPDWELFAESAEGSQGLGEWKLKKVKVLFFSKKGADKNKVEFTVKGQEGTIDGKSKDLHIKGKVSTDSQNGYHMTTEFIEYKSALREIRSPGSVMLVGPKDSYGDGLKVKGIGLLAQVNDSKILIDKDITAEKMVQDQKTFSLQSEKAEFSGKSKRAQFFGHVKMKYNEMTIEGDQSEFSYGERTNLFDDVKVKGLVKLIDAQKRVATSQSLDVNLIDNKFIFSGKPKLIQEGDELSGDEITFFDGGKRVKVDRVKAISK